MKVRAIVAHDNEFGSRYHKPVGAEYEVGDETGKALIDAGYVEEAGSKKSESK